MNLNFDEISFIRTVLIELRQLNENPNRKRINELNEELTKTLSTYGNYFAINLVEKKSDVTTLRYDVCKIIEKLEAILKSATN